MKDLEYQAQKKARSETNLRNIISEKYQDFLDVFFKQNSDTLLSYQKYNHKIILEEV